LYGVNSLFIAGKCHLLKKMLSTFRIMKTILFPTDFSENATHAVRYGYYLAREIKADIILCNAVVIPAEAPQAGLVAWPLDESDILLKDSTGELVKLKSSIEKSRNKTGFHPSIRYFNQSGILTDVVNHIIADEKVDLVVIGTHGSSGLTTLLLGNHSRSMIDGVTKPLLLIPPAAKLLPIKKIAFATDFKNIEEDLLSISVLVALAKPLNAEIQLTHIYEESDKSPEFQKWIHQFVSELSTKVRFSNIKYTMYRSNGAQSGLEWLCDNSNIDVLAMMHRSHTFIDSLFRGSQTQKIARQIPIPLLVFPAKT
jgi:nucleotide-binding universal stress UspA family protein